MPDERSGSVLSSVGFDAAWCATDLGEYRACAVGAITEALTAVVLEPYPPVKRRDRSAARAVVLAELSTQRDTKTAPSALSSCPAVTAVRR